MSSKDKTLTLYRGWLDRGRYVWSPFVTKVEFRLRYAEIPYNAEAGSSRSGPKGKIPYVDIGPLQDTEPEYVGDSSLIIKRLVNMEQLSDLNASLSGPDTVYDAALRALLEDKLYFYNMRERWIDNYYQHRDKILEGKPWLVRYLLGQLIYKKINETTHLQGVGRHTTEEAATFMREIWTDIDKLLSERLKNLPKEEPAWVLGHAQPTEADGVLFGFITSVLVCKSCPRSQDLVKSLPSVLEYADRIHDRYFPDYEKWKA